MTWIKPAGAGVGAAVFAGLATWVYLRSITIDDGLEALAFLPILGLAMVVIGAVAGWRGLPWAWPLTASLGASGAVLIGLLCLAAKRQELLLAEASVATTAFVAAFTMTGSIIGWSLGTWGSRNRQSPQHD